MNIEELYKLYEKHPVVCTDTRAVSKSCLFFALKGDRFDANQFSQIAIQTGAAYAIIDDPQYVVNEQTILVTDVLETLQALATFHRKQLKIPVIGITGSNGKTTTKELMRSVLSQKFKTFATEGNLNNHIGVPLSILAIDKSYEIAIIEMGANHQKEIGFLCNIAQPSYGLITNIGKAHLEGFGGVEGVRKGKGELYEFISKTQGLLFINANDPVLNEMSFESGVDNKIYYGTSTTNFIKSEIYATQPFLEVTWQSERDLKAGSSFVAKSNLTGIYNYDNIVSAICIGSYFNLNHEQINKGINSYSPLNSRSQILITRHNTLICDYYNANPSSMTAALDNLESIEASTKALILGDMFELGIESAEEHRAILDRAMSTNSARKIFIGEDFYKLKESNSAEFFKNVQEAYQAIVNNPIINSTVLVKGSRGMKLEVLLPLL